MATESMQTLDQVINLAQVMKSSTTESTLEVQESSNLWELAKTVYPEGEFIHITWSTAYFCGFYLFLHLLVHVIWSFNSDRYNKMLRPKQGEYRAYVLSIFHSVICVLMSFIAMFYICPNGETVFNSDECIDTPRHLHIWGIVNSSGYFIVDLINTVFVIREFTTYDYQMIGHHIISVITFFGTLVFMNFTTVIGVMLLFVELSTVYICIRWLLYTHRLHRNCCQTVNTIICFLTFLFGRLIFQVIVLFVYAYPRLVDMFDQMEMPWWKVSLIIEIIMATSISALMNTYWMYLIIHQVVRMFKRAERGETLETGESGINGQTDRDDEGYKRGDSEGEGSEPTMANENERVPLIKRKRRASRKDEHHDSSDLSAGEQRSRQARRGPNFNV